MTKGAKVEVADKNAALRYIALHRGVDRTHELEFPRTNVDEEKGAWMDIGVDFDLVVEIGLRATFFDRSAAVSNNVSKATLLYTAHVISQEYANVSYFPSYEITQYLAKDPFGWDGRHVNKTTVDLIMSLFVRTYLKPN